MDLRTFVRYNKKIMAKVGEAEVDGGAMPHPTCGQLDSRYGGNQSGGHVHGGDAENKNKRHAFAIDIDSATFQETAFMREVARTAQMELFTMSVPPKSEIPAEKHEGTTQMIRVVYGKATAIVRGRQYFLQEGKIIMIPAGVVHRIINMSDSEPLQLWTTYAPPIHKPGTLQLNPQ